MDTTDLLATISKLREDITVWNEHFDGEIPMTRQKENYMELKEVLKELEAIRSQVERNQKDIQAIYKMLAEKQVSEIGAGNSAIAVIDTGTVPAILRTIIGTWKLVTSNGVKDYLRHCNHYVSTALFRSKIKFTFNANTKSMTCFVDDEPFRISTGITQGVWIANEMFDIVNDHLIVQWGSSKNVVKKCEVYFEKQNLHVITTNRGYTCERVYEKVN
uniref:Uncharacterized protein n=1 Tax=Caenorhabditis japonica TaxID=281687 RepID=A0A8R1IB65_CAEJA